MHITSNSGEKRILFDPATNLTCQKKVAPIEEQEEFESRKYVYLYPRLWERVAIAIKKGDQELATLEKERIEENQRNLVKSLPGEWQSRFFEFVDGKWLLKILTE